MVVRFRMNIHTPAKMDGKPVVQHYPDKEGGWVRYTEYAKLKAERDAANAVAKAYVEQVDELETLVANLSESLTGCNENNRKFAKEFRKHIALRDGLQALADDYDEWNIPVMTSAAKDIRALLGKESEE